MSSTLEEKRNFAKLYIESLVKIEEEMEVYKEHKRDLRDEYRSNGWMTTHEIAATVRAWRIVVAANKGNLDLDDLFEQVEMFAGATRDSINDRSTNTGDTNT